MSSVFKPNNGSYIIKGDTTITANIEVGGTATISSDFTVDGESFLNSNVTITNGTLSVDALATKITILDTSDVDLLNPIYGDAALNLAGGAHIMGNLYVHGSIVANGDVTSNGN